MPPTNSNDAPLLVIGVLGIFALLLIAIGYAYWDSGAHYQAEQINQFVLEQSIQTTR